MPPQDTCFRLDNMEPQSELKKMEVKASPRRPDDFHTPREDSILCTCCKKYFSDDDEAGGNPYMEMCADCLKCFDEDSQKLPNDVDSVSTFEQDHKENSPLVGDGEDPALTETPLKGLDIIATQKTDPNGEDTTRVYFRGGAGLLTRLSDDQYRLKLDKEDGGEEFVFENDEYLRDYIDDIEFVSCISAGCSDLPVIQCSCQGSCRHWKCNYHADESCPQSDQSNVSEEENKVALKDNDATETEASLGANDTTETRATLGANDATETEATLGANDTTETQATLGANDATETEATLGAKYATGTEVASKAKEANETTDVFKANEEGTEATKEGVESSLKLDIESQAKGIRNSPNVPMGLLPHLGSSPPTRSLCLLPPVPKVVIADKVLPGSILSAMKNDAKYNQQTMAQLLKSLYSVFSALTWETETSVTVFDSVRNFKMLSFRSDSTKNTIKSKFGVDLLKRSYPDFFFLNKWILCDFYYSVSSVKVILLSQVYVRCLKSNRLFWCEQLGRTKCIDPNVGMFLFDAYTLEECFNLNIQVTKYVIVPPEELPKALPPLNLQKIDLAMKAWIEKKKYDVKKGPNRDETGLTVMTDDYLLHSKVSLGADIGERQAQIEVDRRVALFEDYLQKKQRQDRASSRSATKLKYDSVITTKRARSAKNYSSFFDEEDDEESEVSYEEEDGDTSTSSISKGSVSSSSKSSSSSNEKAPDGLAFDESKALATVDKKVQECVATQVSSTMDSFLSRLETSLDQKITTAVQPLQDSMKTQQLRIDALTDKFFVASGNHTSDIRELKRTMTLKLNAMQDRIAQLEQSTGVSAPPLVDPLCPIDMTGDDYPETKKRPASTDIESGTHKRLAAMERNQADLSSTLKELALAITASSTRRSQEIPLMSKSLFNTPVSSPCDSPEYELLRKFGSFLSTEARDDKRRQFFSQFGMNY